MGKTGCLDKKRIALAYILILTELIIQITGGLFYEQMPGFFWDLANTVLIMVPLVFGLGYGLLCLIPFAVSEIIWSCMLHSVGPFLHLVSFAVATVILGLAGKKVRETPPERRLILNVILYEAVLLGEEALYQFLRMMIMHSPISWSDMFSTFLSPANPLLLILVILCSTSFKNASRD